MNAVVHRHDLAECFREAEGNFISPSKIGNLLGLQTQELAERAGVHRNTLGRRPHASSVQSYLRDVLRVLILLNDITEGDAPRAAYWFINHPIPEFDYRTADELVRGHRTADVISYLQSIAEGPTG